MDQKTIGDHLNELAKSGELTRLFKAGIITAKWENMRNVYNYYNATKSIRFCCDKFKISKATVYLYLNTLNKNI